MSRHIKEGELRMNTQTIGLSNATYDKLKVLVQLILPAVSTLYFTLSSIWGLPYAEQIVGTIAAICVFFGAVLKLSSNSYAKDDSKFVGVVNIETGQDDVTKYNLDVLVPLDELPNRSEGLFKFNTLPDE